MAWCRKRSNLVFTYTQLLPRLDRSGRHLILSGVTNRTYRVEFKTQLEGGTNWTPLTNITFPANRATAVISNALNGTASNRFFRAVRAP